MTRLSLFSATLFLGTLVLGISGCGASEPGTQTVSTAPAAGQPANPRVLIETSASGSGCVPRWAHSTRTAGATANACSTTSASP